MKKSALCLAFILLAANNPILAQEVDHSDRKKNDTPDHELTADKPADYHSPPAEPLAGKNIRKYARDEQGRGASNFGTIPVHDNMMFYTFRADRFEQRIKEGNDVALWDVQGWIGADYNKLYLKSEGEYNTDKSNYESAQVELLYSRTVSTFWDVQAGLRHDFINNTDDRNFVALGVQGLAPYWFEVDATSYVSDEGDVSAIVEAEYDLLLSQRLILQPRFETKIALQDVPEYNIGSGINGIELGIRLRYEITREFAPYIGVELEQNLGETKNMLEAAGKNTSSTAFVGGARFWF